MKRTIIALLLCAILLLAGCSRLEAAVDAFLGNGQSQGVEVDQNIAINGDNSFLTPGGSMITVITPDGNISYSPIYPDSNGGISVIQPDINYETFPVQQDFYTPNWMFGFWQAYQTDYLMNGEGAAPGFELCLAGNGYGVLQMSDGIVSGGNYYVNYTSARLYGRWQVSEDLFQFIVTEDWFDASGTNIGLVLELPYAPTGDGFALTHQDVTWTFHEATDYSNYLETIIKADGGPTGNDLTGTRNESESNIEGLVGSWKMYENASNGEKIRHLFQFNSNGSFDYTRERMVQENGVWQSAGIIDPYIRCGGYYMLNGYFTIAWDCYEVSGLAVTVNGDTMTMSTVPSEYFWEEQSGTFTRYDGSANPQP